MFVGGKFRPSVNCQVHEEDCHSVDLGNLCGSQQKGAGHSHTISIWGETHEGAPREEEHAHACVLESQGRGFCRRNKDFDSRRLRFRPMQFCLLTLMLLDLNSPSCEGLKSCLVSLAEP